MFKPNRLALSKHSFASFFPRTLLKNFLKEYVAGELSEEQLVKMLNEQLLGYRFKRER
jgi:hypothetical protein